jgi:hypothetical protein
MVLAMQIFVQVFGEVRVYYNKSMIKMWNDFEFWSSYQSKLIESLYVYAWLLNQNSFSLNLPNLYRIFEILLSNQKHGSYLSAF